MALPVPLVVCGAAGRMGRRIIALAHEDPEVRIVGAVESDTCPEVGRDAGELAGIGSIGVRVASEYKPLAKQGTVTLDFTAPAASMNHLHAALERRAAILIGTSGLSAHQREEIAEAGQRIPVMLAANMSRGVNVLLELVERAAHMLGPGFDCEIVELHHNRKKDAPSGTALALAEAAAAAKGLDRDKALVLARQGMVGERKRAEIGVVALRGGDAAGDHTVLFVGNGERVELVHRTVSRDCLAAGAISAGRWLATRKPGLYSMRDVVASTLA